MTDPSVNATAIANVLGATLSAMHNGGHKSHWLRLYDHPDDRPENLPSREGMTETQLAARRVRKKLLVGLAPMSLRAHLQLSYDGYLGAMNKCRFFKTKNSRWGMAVQFQTEAFRNFLDDHGMEDAELEPAEVQGTKQVYYLRLGPQQAGYNRDVHQQVRNGQVEPPRYSIDPLRRKLCMAVTGRDCATTFMPEDVSSDSGSDDDSDDGSDDMSCDGNGDAANAADGSSEAMGDGSDTVPGLGSPASGTGDDAAGGAMGNADSNKFPELHKLGINLDLSDKRNASYVKTLIGELFALQHKYSKEEKKAIEASQEYLQCQ